MNYVDLIILALIIIGAFIGFKRGFTKELVSFLGFILAIVIAFLFKDIVDNIQSFGELINSKESFTDEELDKLNIVLSDENIYEIKNVQELMNIEQIKKTGKS